MFVARNNADAIEQCLGLIKSNNLGACSGMKLARKLCFCRNSKHFCASDADWTTMQSSMQHAVEHFSEIYTTLERLVDD